MSCRELVGFLGDYLDGDLAPKVRIVFERHLADCPDCRDFLDSYEATIRLGRMAFCQQDDAMPADVPDDLVRAVIAARSLKD